MQWAVELKGHFSTLSAEWVGPRALKYFQALSYVKGLSRRASDYVNTHFRILLLWKLIFHFIHSGCYIQRSWDNTKNIFHSCLC